jgi:hypothetical protein
MPSKWLYIVAYYVHVVVYTHTTFICPFFYILSRCEKIVRVGLSFGSRSYLTAPMYPSLSLSLLGNLTLPPFVVVCAPQHDDQISLSKWPPSFFFYVYLVKRKRERESATLIFFRRSWHACKSCVLLRAPVSGQIWSSPLGRFLFLSCVGQQHLIWSGLLAGQTGL